MIAARHLRHLFGREFDLGVLIDLHHVVPHRCSHLPDLGRIGRSHDLETVGRDDEINVRPRDVAVMEHDLSGDRMSPDHMAVTGEPEQPGLSGLDVESARRDHVIDDRILAGGT